MRTKGIGPQGLGISPFKNHEVGLTDPNADAEFMEEYNRYTVNSKDAGISMTQGEGLDEIVINAPKTYTNKKTRAEHRLDKTQQKLEISEDAVGGGGGKSDRLRRREARLEAKVERQEGRNKKKYARKAKKEKRSKNW